MKDRKIIQYLVVCDDADSTDRKGLPDYVNKNLAEGLEPIGGVSVIQAYGEKGFCWYQAMVKYE